MPANALSIAESRSGPVCIVALSGRIDSSNADRLSARLAELLAAKDASVVVDFHDVLYLTSAASSVARSSARTKPRGTA